MKENETQNRNGKKKVKLFKPRKKKSVEEDAAISFLQAQYEKISPEDVKTFKDLPLSQKTLKGLKENNYTIPTEIQRQAIGHALLGKDILGAAKTGSGKTLAFLIPILEKLFCLKWTRMDGLGALVISPTRELAYQIYETLRKIGHHHDFSAGLIIGGQNLKFERKRMDQVNILICTPGRLLQHMDENPLFDCSNLKILILDEADRCLDMGFAETMNAIIENLPPNRQTLLFSATQTKSIKDLARLSLSFPTYIAPHEQAETTTPDTLKQSYIVCEVDEKLGILWSFIKNHLKQKVLVFMATCKQVKFTYDLFCKLRPGVSVLALYGTLHQEKREKIYNDFCRKSNVVLIATDLASRGLDFPHVNWVLQVDCPEDVETYIHRAGRTARGLTGKGEGLLMLMPSEEQFIDDLKGSKIPINKIAVDPSKVIAPQRKIEALLTEYQDLKQSAQRAFVSYVKSIYLMKNKELFNLQLIDTDAYSRSLGLVVPPTIKFLQKLQYRSKSNQSTQGSVDILEKINNDNDTDSENESDDGEELKVKSDKAKIKQTIIKELRHKPEPFKIDLYCDDDSEEEFLTVKKKGYEIGEESEEIELLPSENPISKKNKKPITKAAIAKKLAKKNIKVNTKVVFTEEGEVVHDEKREMKTELAKHYDDTQGGIDIEKAKLILQEEDKYDKIRFKEKVRAKHKEMKRKLKNKKKKDEEEKDDFGSQSESDGPDLSWLPDPDKVYAKEIKSSGDEDDSEHDEEPIHRPSKRKLITSKGIPQEDCKPHKKAKVKDISASLTVNEAEALAMQFLKKK